MVTIRKMLSTHGMISPMPSITINYLIDFIYWSLYICNYTDGFPKSIRFCFQCMIFKLSLDEQEAQPKDMSKNTQQAIVMVILQLGIRLMRREQNITNYTILITEFRLQYGKFCILSQSSSIHAIIFGFSIVCWDAFMTCITM